MNLTRVRLPHPLVSVPALILYGAAVFGANWLTVHVGTVVLPGGIHLLPVGFGLLAPSGTAAAAAVLVARDVVQRTAGRSWSLAIILPAALATAAMDPRLALASGGAFLVAELLDYAVYTRLQQRFGRAVFWSTLLGAALDSLCFLFLLGILSWPVLLGQWLAKGYVAVVAGLVGSWLRKVLPAARAPRHAPTPRVVKVA
jgi:uncharacterized PurR-regulated membrane protein YhhQ (DUF165 family)